MSIVNGMLRILGTWMEEFRAEGVKIPKDIEDILGNAALFSVIWSIGAAIDESSRKGFHDFVTKLITAAADIPEQFNLDLELPFEPHAIHAKIPEKTSIFELCFDRQKQMWIHWMQTVPPFTIPKGIEYHQLLIPTTDSVRNNYFLHLCVRNKIHLLLSGPTGTGKTVNVLNELNRHYFNVEYTNLCTAFSGQTTANQVQKLIESKVCTRRRKGYYGPEEGKK